MSKYKYSRKELFYFCIEVISSYKNNLSEFYYDKDRYFGVFKNLCKEIDINRLGLDGIYTQLDIRLEACKRNKKMFIEKLDNYIEIEYPKNKGNQKIENMIKKIILAKTTDEAGRLAEIFYYKEKFF